jgi:hypothetical protein
MLGPEARAGTSRAGCMSVGEGEGKRSGCEEAAAADMHKTCAMFEDVQRYLLLRPGEKSAIHANTHSRLQLTY